ncbi:MAG: DUF2877 domain-containing protein [Deltaproteobacteria bacterium]|nr:DUF2877 domain-containing protein [Deltaproteobacteria bacterium]
MNPDNPYPIRFQALKMGAAAARVLTRSGQGYVNAVFKRCFYCEINDNFICIGSPTLGMCPLNVTTSMPEGDIRVFPGLVTGMAVRVCGDYVRIGGERFLLKTDGGGVWLPPPPSATDPQKIKSGLNALEKVAAPRLPKDGLGRFIDTFPFPTLRTEPVLTQAAWPLKRLQGWLRQSLADPQNIQDPDIFSWKRLLGLGPGLTPSGDDLVGGVMLGLHSLGCFPIIKTLSSAITQVLAESTNPISAAHLRCAMEGTGSKTAHSAINAILSGNRKEISQIPVDIEKIGHTSGWDMLAGIVIVFRLWLESAEACQSAA